LFPNYHTGALNNYHISYWAGTRGSANLRKNHGSMLAAVGNDVIAGQTPGPHRVRLLKTGGKVRLEARGKRALSYDDPGKESVWTDGSLVSGKVLCENR